MARTNLNWQLDRETWTDELPEPPQPPRPRFPLSRRSTAALLVALLLVGAFVAYRYRTNSEALRAALVDTVEQETLVWNTGARPAYAEMLDPEAAQGWRSALLAEMDATHGADHRPTRQVSVGKIDWRGDIASVEVQVVQTPGWRTLRWTYRPGSLAGGLPQIAVVEDQADRPVEGTETRFYRLAGNIWRRTAPDSRFLGPEQRRSTAHFELHFPQADAASATQLAASLESIAADLAARYGQAPLAPGERLVVRLVPGLTTPAWDATGVDLPSPGSAPLSDESQPAVRLLLPVKAMLVGKLVDRLVGDKPNDIARVLAMGLVEHELEELSPNTWRQARLEALVNRWPGNFRPLVSLLRDLPAGSSDTYAVDAWLLVRYVARQYGDERLAGLLRLARDATGWESLLQRGLGIGLADFERDWWSALAGEYVMAPYRPGAAGLDLLRLQSDLQAAVEAEFKAMSDRSGPRVLQGLDPRAPAQWRSTQAQAGPLAASGEVRFRVEVIRVRDDIALVSAAATSNSGENGVTQWLFYRFDGQRWWHTAPVEALWGERRERDTGYFHLVYFEADAPAVEAIAGGLDRFYTALQNDLALPALRSSVPITVQVVPAATDRLPAYRFPTGPYGALVEVFPAQSTRTARLERHLEIVLQSPLVTGFGRDGPATVLRLNLGFTLGIGILRQAALIPRFATPLPESVEEMVRWEMDRQWPLSGSRRAAAPAVLREALEAGTLVPLDELGGVGTRDAGRAELAAAEVGALLDFVGEVYGRQRWPEVLRARLRHADWPGTLSAALGQPAGEIETRWRTYLAETYRTPD